MKIKKFSKYLNLLFFLCIFFANTNNIFADTRYERYELKDPETQELVKLSEINLEKDRIERGQDGNRIAVCVYSCSYNNSINYKLDNEAKEIEYGITCGPEKSKWNWITYQMNDDVATSQKGSYWHISAGMTQQHEATYSNHHEGVYQGYSKSYLLEWADNIPGDVSLPAVFFEDSTDDDKNQLWQTDQQSYIDLNESFICPKYVYYDKTNTYITAKNNMELCYANEQGKCETRNEKVTKFEEPDVLTYSFVEELDKVLDHVYTDIESDSDMNILKPYTDESLNGQEFKDNVCALMKLNALDSNTNALEANIVNETFLEMDLNKRLSNAINLVNSNSYNLKFFNYKSLTTLMLDNKSIDPKNLKYNNNSLKEKYQNILKYHSERIIGAVEKYKTECEAGTEGTITLDTESLKEKINKELDKIVIDYQDVNLEPLNCDNLFADFADVIKTAYFLIEIGSLVLVIVLSVLEYAKIILADGQDEMKKANQKLIKRLIVLVVIFLLPALVNLILTVFKIEGFNSDNPLCIKEINK